MQAEEIALQVVRPRKQRTGFPSNADRPCAQLSGPDERFQAKALRNGAEVYGASGVIAVASLAPREKPTM
jgi:hypothetical protein